MTPLHATIIDTFTAHVHTLDRLLAAQATYKNHALLAIDEGTNAVCFLREGGAVFLRAGEEEVALRNEEPSTNHERIAGLAALQEAEATFSSIGADMGRTLRATFDAILQGPVAQNTPYRPHFLSGSDGRYAWIAISANTGGSSSAMSDILLEGPNLRYATNLALACAFNTTLGTGRPWTLRHRHASHVHTVVAPTPGDALQWAALLHDQHALMRGTYAMDGVSDDEAERSLFASWDRIHAT